MPSYAIVTCRKRSQVCSVVRGRISFYNIYCNTSDKRQCSCKATKCRADSMWRRRRRKLRVRKYAILSARASLCAGLCASAALYAAASDEHALRQALTIVQLLRAEFGRLDPRSTEPPAPTCAQTPAVLSSQSEPSRRQWTTWNKKVKPLRRMDYEDAFGAHPSSRDTPKPLTSASSTSHPASTTGSSESANPPSTPTQPSIPTTASSTPTTQPSEPATLSISPTQHSAHTTASSPTPNKPTTTSSPPSTLTLPSSPIPVTSRLSPSAKVTSTRAASFKASSTKSSQKTLPATLLQSTKQLSTDISFSISSVLESEIEKPVPPTKPGRATRTPKKLGWTKNPVITDTARPELQQVALELAGELESGVPSYEPELRPKTRTKPRPKARATWRVHLARSTRYAVPLPENHAFCYTDPDNALCRTLI